MLAWHTLRTIPDGFPDLAPPARNDGFRSTDCRHLRLSTGKTKMPDSSCVQLRCRQIARASDHKSTTPDKRCLHVARHRVTDAHTESSRFIAEC